GAYLADLDPEAVVLATGATTDAVGFASKIGDGSVAAWSIDEAMTADVSGKRIVVLDHLGDAAVYTAAERAADAGGTVTVLTPMPTIANHVGFTHIKDLLGRLYAAGVAQH